MSKARTEFELVGDAEAAARLDKITVALNNLNRAHLSGQITRDQLTKATDRLGTAERLLESRLQTTKQQMGVASQQLQRTTHDIRGARDAADLLSYQLGVPLPREMKRLISQSTLIGPALSAAFKVTAVVAAIGIIIKYREEIAKTAQAVGGYTEAVRAMEQADIAASNAMLMNVRNFKEAKARSIELSKEIAGLRDEIHNYGLSLLDVLTAATGGSGELPPGLGTGVVLAVLFGSDPDKAQERLKQLLPILDQINEKLKKFREGAKPVRLQDIAGPQFAGVFPEKPPTLFGAGQLALSQFDLQNLPIQPRGGAQLSGIPSLIRHNADEASKALRQLQEQSLDLVVSQLDGEQKIIAEMERKLAVLAVMKTEWIGYGDVVKQIEALEVLTQQNAANEIATIQREKFDKMAQSIESFFQRVALTARSWKDVMNQLWTAVLGNFLSMVSRMAAGWLLGQRQMTVASATGGGGGGGGLGGFLGQLFGLGRTTGGGGFFGVGGVPTGIGPGGTAPFNPAAGFAAAAGLPVGLAGTGVLRGGESLAAGLPVGATGGGTASTIAAGGLGSIAQLGMLGALLAPLAIGFGSPVRGAVSGGILGGAAGLLLMGALGPFAAIGAIIGALFGFGRSTRKSRLRIEEDIKRQAKQIEDAFKLHKMDYASAIQGLEQLREQGVDALRRAGVKDIDRARRGHVDQWIDGAIQRINSLEEQRGLTTNLRAFNLIPEFAIGGRVHAPGGARLVMAHDREVILNQSQQMMVGPERITRALRTTGAPHLDTGGSVGRGFGGGMFIQVGDIIVNGASGDGRALGREMFEEFKRRLNESARAKGMPPVA